MADPVSRSTLFVQTMPATRTSSVEVRRITMSPGVRAGAHLHNGPVFGPIERGSVVFRVEGDQERVLSVGDVFYEPADEVVARWDATDEGVVFLACFLLDDGQTPELTPVIAVP